MTRSFDALIAEPTCHRPELGIFVVCTAASSFALRAYRHDQRRRLIFAEEPGPILDGVADHVRRGGKSVQEQHDRPLLRPGFAVADVQAVDGLRAVTRHRGSACARPWSGPRGCGPGADIARKTGGTGQRGKQGRVHPWTSSMVSSECHVCWCHVCWCHVCWCHVCWCHVCWCGSAALSGLPASLPCGTLQPNADRRAWMIWATAARTAGVSARAWSSTKSWIVAL